MTADQELDEAERAVGAAFLACLRGEISAIEFKAVSDRGLDPPEILFEIDLVDEL